MIKDEIGVICQARLSSRRLPGKVLYDLGYGNSIKLIHSRYLKQLDKDYKLIIATSTSPEDKAIEAFCRERNISCFKGSLDNVLERYYQCSLKYNFKYIIRVTADCPFIDFTSVPNMLEILQNSNSDYITNSHNESGHVPDGFDLEIFTFDALSKAYNLPDLLPSEKEHVTFQFLKRSNFKSILYRKSPDFIKNLRLTLDEPEDYQLIRKLTKNIDYEELQSISMIEICNYILENNLSDINANIIKNSGWASAFEKDSIFLNNRKNSE